MYVMLSGHSSPIPFLFVCCFLLVPCFSVIPPFCFFAPCSAPSPLSLLACGLCFAGGSVALPFLLVLLFVACRFLVLCVGATGQCIGSFPLAWLPPPPFYPSLFLPFLSTSSSCFLVHGRRPCWRIATSRSCFWFFSSLCLLCCVLMSWGGVLAGWLCCVGVVYVFSLCSLLRRRKVLPLM